MMLSVVILSKNNSASIPRTLESVKWCDEIVLIDDFSSDDTVVIAKKYKVRVFQRHLQNDFASQRNFGLDRATCDWVLFIDSDEVVTDALQQEIRETISQKGIDGEGIVGYSLKRDDIFFGKKIRFGETGNVKLLRLARRSAGTWIRPVHEYWNVKGLTKTLVNPLLHYSHTNVAQFINDINTYTTINASYLYKQGVRSNLIQILAYPKVKFFQNYFIRLGFLDGTPGFVMAIVMSFHSFLTRSKLYLLSHKK